MIGKIPNTEDFQKEISQRIKEAKDSGLSYIDLVSGDIHRKLGGYPNQGNHRMRTCCDVMRDLMRPGDEVVSGPAKERGATMKIRYYT